MNSEQAGRLVDAWAKNWRKYLDGQLHKLPRQALIDAIVAATAEGDDTSEDFDGRPMTDAGLRAYMRKVHEGEQAGREPAATVEGVAAASAAEDAERQAASDALAVMQAHGGRVLMLRPSQVERFKRFGLLDGVSFEVSEPVPVTDDTEPAEEPRRRGRPPSKR